MQFKEGLLVPETMLPTQRSHGLSKHKKSVIFGILVKGDHMKNFWKCQILEMAESDIFV